MIRENLLGYLLGALEEHEHEDVRRQIEQSPDLRRELECMKVHTSRLQSALIEEHSPPLGLAQRTCEFVEQRRITVATSNSHPVGMSPSPRERAAAASRWSRLDMIVALVVVFVSAGLFLPAISTGRHQSQVANCQNNLNHVGRAYDSYSTFNAGMFPSIPTRENATEGVYSRAAFTPMTLLKQKHLPSRRMLVCPSSERKLRMAILRVPVMLPDTRQMSEKKVIVFFNRVGGNYAYNLGYRNQKGVYTAVRNRHRPTYALVSDTPREDHQGSNSHGRRGWNVLFEDGHAAFVTHYSIGGRDANLFLSERGVVEAGSHSEDAVLAPGGTQPVTR